MTVRERIIVAIDHLRAARRWQNSVDLARRIDSAERELHEALLTLDATASVDALPPGDPRRR